MPRLVAHAGHNNAGHPNVCSPKMLDAVEADQHSQSKNATSLQASCHHSSMSGAMEQDIEPKHDILVEGSMATSDDVRLMTTLLLLLSTWRRVGIARLLGLCPALAPVLFCST
jgi:hypothetical protein